MIFEFNFFIVNFITYNPESQVTNVTQTQEGCQLTLDMNYKGPVLFMP